ncbi:hypothetical protein [Lentilactobacillus buchneri]|uniref:Uncharacterized protein n=1 Tax=Lentilactobacillus buchneri subsp. silagei CD034 TaxID=1071400 RepID=J9W4F2_LENBU|nr:MULTISPECIES: hypothetical protein [Lentilactobacillus]MCC6101463.1 hypothetical protein [Lactobacillus sp.]AFS01214.1 hypothetical protein LBUCD034_2238 [Lentilactobacillus buchneri subsp. silagei CD034]MCT2901304.1 hypothetical protein [Lentilactobacillus buchneri]MCT3541690.1 hypothetical protein [Lentilactobacillus buchneri]MCT3543919.1 hypothetical protein [Lentilactobacillus buchneri]
MLKDILTNIGLVLGLMIGVPFLFIYLLSSINHGTKQRIANQFGIGGQIGFGFLGIIIHEASHLLVALIFGHHIDQFRLLRVPSADNDTLGYVHHTWNKRNLYQNMGNLFIGVAPIFGCCLSVLLLAKYFVPEVYQSLMTTAEQPLSQLVVVLPTFNWLSMGLFLIIAANICIGGFDLSPADFENSKQGFWQAVICLTLLAIIISLTPLQATLFSLLIRLTVIIVVISLFNLLISVVMNLIFRFI